MVRDNILYEVIRYAAIYASIEMGVTLRNTAYSPNIKDRLDHTCAVLDPDGDLVAQAEHIPVHIGSMAIGVKNTIDYIVSRGDSIEDGDIIMVNDPYIAGTHLNDILLLKPVFVGGRLVGYVANKAHHVDIGGQVPGSIGGHAREIYQEGVSIPPIKLYRGGVLDKNIIDIISSNVRTPSYFKGDLNAQVASLYVGERRLKEIVNKYGLDNVLSAWRYVIDYGARYVLNRIRGIGRFGVFSAVDEIEVEDGRLLQIKVRIRVKKDGINIDFSGTHRQVDYPVNAVFGVTVASTTFAIKSLLDPDMPINHGIYRVIDVYAPKSSLLNPVPPAPVSGGNVETSQRIVDVIFRALRKYLPDRVPAASCGSMNNIMVGGILGDGSTWAFYETVGGGSGARPSSDGVDGIHTNMTNTLNTPIEIVEKEYPIFFIKYEFRRDSCGSGKYRGGLGISRVFQVLRKSSFTLMAERVRTSPWGLEGGRPGKPGEHYIVKADGRRLDLPSKASVELDVGDTIYINTPGGGGYGDPHMRPRVIILSDILDDRITLDYAREEYGFETE
jgi:N-methylhydantoinase B